MRSPRLVVPLLVFLVGLFVRVDQAAANPRQGLSLGFGIGAMFAVDEESYYDIGDDLYPEVQLAYDIGPVKLGLHGGYIWREETVEGGGRDVAA